jgi:hypothetical protein
MAGRYRRIRAFGAAWVVISKRGSGGLLSALLGELPATADWRRIASSSRLAAAALVFAQALPGGVEPGPEDSKPYAQWLGGEPGAGNGR